MGCALAETSDQTRGGGIMDTLSVVQTGLALQNSRFAASLHGAVAKTTSDQQKAEGEMAVQLIQSARAVAPSSRGYSPGQLLNVSA